MLSIGPLFHLLHLLPCACSCTLSLQLLLMHRVVYDVPKNISSSPNTLLCQNSHTLLHSSFSRYQIGFHPQQNVGQSGSEMRRYHFYCMGTIRRFYSGQIDNVKLLCDIVPCEEVRGTLQSEPSTLIRSVEKKLYRHFSLSFSL